MNVEQEPPQLLHSTDRCRESFEKKSLSFLSFDKMSLSFLSERQIVAKQHSTHTVEQLKMKLTLIYVLLIKWSLDFWKDLGRKH